jgi:hypothetical protein
MERANEKPPIRRGLFFARGGGGVGIEKHLSREGNEEYEEQDEKWIHYQPAQCVGAGLEHCVQVKPWHPAKKREEKSSKAIRAAPQLPARLEP